MMGAAMRRAFLSLLLLAGCADAPQALPDSSLAEAAASAAAAVSASPLEPKTYERVILSDVYEVDRIYKSMEGPASTESVTLGKTSERELLWIVGFEAVMVEPESGDQLSQEFMCHTNLDIDPELHTQQFKSDKRITGRLFTLSQGQYRIDLPPGYGIPITSDELLSVNTQVLNLNKKDIKRQVRHKVIMRFQRDGEQSRPMQALYVAGAFGMKVIDGKDGHYGVDTSGRDKTAEEAGECLPGASASNNTFEDGHGRNFTGHWVVKPGREVNHTRVTPVMDLPFDTAIHYVAVHLHPFAESLELIDVTAGKSVYKAQARQVGEGIGLAHVDFFSSPEGIPLFKDHEYEVVSVYNNTTQQDQDSMAVLNLYVLDKEFKKPDLSAPPPAPPPRDAAPAASAKPGQMM
jgi:hypothetical protein